MEFKEIAEDLLEKKDYGQLLELSEKEILTNPNNPDGYEYKYYCLDDDDERLECCNKVLELNPANFHIHGQKAGLLFDKTKNLKEFLDYFEDLQSKYPDTAEVYYTEADRLHVIYLFDDTDNRITYKDTIIKLCKKTIELDKNIADTYYILGNVLGDFENPKEELEEAIEYYKKYLELEPAAFFIHFCIAKCMEDMQQKDRAIEYYDNLISRYCDNYEVYLNKANLLTDIYSDKYWENKYKNKNQLNALKAEIESLIHKAIELEPNNAELYKEISDLYYISFSDYESALYMLEKAIESETDEDKKKRLTDSANKLMKYKQCFAYKFLMMTGIMFWAFIIPYLLLILPINPVPGTFTYTLLYVIGALSIIWLVIGFCVFVPLSYFVFFVLLIWYIYKARCSKLSHKIITYKYHYIYVILAVLGFISGGIISVQSIYMMVR